MIIESKYEHIFVRYKNLDEFIKEQDNAITKDWIVVSTQADTDLSLLVEYKRLVSGVSVDVLADFLKTVSCDKVLIRKNTNVEYNGSVSALLKSKIISDKYLLRRRVRKSFVTNGLLQVEV